MSAKRTASPWKVWRLAPDSDPQEHCIITTQDGETEICGHIYNEAHAPLLAAALEMREALAYANEQAPPNDPAQDDSALITLEVTVGWVREVRDALEKAGGK